MCAVLRNLQLSTSEECLCAACNNLCTIPLQLVFNDKRDSQLITETMQEDPYSSEDPNSVWDTMAINLLRTYRQDTPTLRVVMGRTIRDRKNLLITHFHSDDKRKLSRY